MSGEIELESAYMKKERLREKKAEEKAQDLWNSWGLHQKMTSPWVKWYRKNILYGLYKFNQITKKMQKKGLFDSYTKRPINKGLKCGKFEQFNRRIDGACNDLNDPLMGAALTRFGRNVGKKYQVVKNNLLLFPNPRTISRRLLTRKTFIPNKNMNLLAVAWIQFLLHDVISHGDNENPNEVPPFYIPLEHDDPLGTELFVPKSAIDFTRPPALNKKVPTFLNHTTHWLDLSPVYGHNISKAQELRSFVDGQLKLDRRGFLNRNVFGKVKTGRNENWWLGLSLIHTMMANEHNQIARNLKKAYPHFKENELYHKSRLILAALMAKIIVKDFLPAFNRNQVFRKTLDVLYKDDLGGEKKLNQVPYAATEDFTSLYRFHSMLPDIISSKDGTHQYELKNLRENAGEDLLHEIGIEASFRLLGSNFAGELTLFNFPKSLQNINIPLTGKMDLGTLDILRDRERGVPRYNDFRRSIGLTPIKKFEDLTNDKNAVKILKEVYHNNIELLDLKIGTLSESIRPTGFSLGETILHIASMMVRRKITSDRFFTSDFNEKVYTEFGMKWVLKNNMKTILLRNFPNLKKDLYGHPNPFMKW